jgi:hypothetical protein
LPVERDLPAVVRRHPCHPTVQQRV